MTPRILTTPVDGFGDPKKIIKLLREDKTALKVYVEVSK